MDKAQLKTLETLGYAVKELPTRTIPRLTFYKPDGESLVLLADPYHMQRYLKRGFSLEPPLTVKPQGVIVCETCGKTFKTKLGLSGHSRSHKK